MRWVQLLPDGRAAGYLADDSPSSNPSTTELYAQPIIRDNSPVQLLPPWFRRLLYSPGYQFDQLREAAQRHDDWGVYADIVRYRRLNIDIAWFRDELEAAQIELDTAIKARQSCEGRLEAAHATTHFGHLAPARDLHFDGEHPAKGRIRRNRFKRGRVNN
jgi:hypothetical protein